MAIAGLHPILYVPDQYAERDFYLRFGFETVYEGPEFPGFLAVGTGSVIIGLSSRPEAHVGGLDNIRWQFVVDDVDEIVSACEAAGIPYEIEVETGGDTHRTRIVKVRSPGGVLVWFEGPNELAGA
ncbi:MAG TPA: VOC family protein [Micromonosporaceae bacterium]|jgi:catechol 2,3-dioxygenase-like lactoylglutathione lyase family enzyme